MKKLEAQWLPRNQECDQATTSPLRLAAIVTPALGLLLATVLAFVCCCLERTASSRERKKRSTDVADVRKDRLCEGMLS